MMRKVTFWQNMPSHHMSPVQRELARLPGYQVRTVFAQRISDHRTEMGWSIPDLLPAETTFLDNNASLAREIAQESNGLNFFGGFPMGVLKEAFRNLRTESDDTRRALILEAGDTLGFKGKLRPLFHTILAKNVGSQVDFILAFGSIGVDYYTNCGFSRDRVYPFFYQSEEPVITKPKPSSYPMRLVYCGQFSKRKGVDLLLYALAKLTHLNWELEIVGGGPEGDYLKKLAKTLDLSHRISWRGYVPSSEVGKILRGKDICVIPSRFDGWGMLTNEALSAGVAVVTTSRVGSKDMVEANGAGRVSASPTPEALGKCIEELLAYPEKLDQVKKLAARISPKFSGLSSAHYLDKIIRGEVKKGDYPLYAH